MAILVRSKDWSKTPLGPIDHWPQSLRTAVSLCLASNFPINIIWGPQHTQIYNDGYRVVCGDAHPTALGQGYDVTWASAWPAIGNPFARARAGETSFLENQRMFLTRNGYFEETFFTFSLSPIRDESGEIGGVFHPVTETTAMMLSERRTRAVRDLTASLGALTALSDLAPATIATLSGFQFDLPFALFYELTPDGTRYALTAHHGMRADIPASLAELDTQACTPWPIRQAQAGLAEVSDVASVIRDTPCGPYEEPPNRAFILPVTIPGASGPPIIVVLGVSPRLPLDDAYRGFHELLGAAMSASLTTIRAREDERRRAEALAAIDRAKTAFFSNVSHEFRTPLTLMLGPLEDALADAGSLSVMQQDRLQVAHRNALRLLRLVNTLLDFSRIEAGRVLARFQPTSLSEITVDLVSNFESACARAGLWLHADCPPLSGPVYVDRDMWEKIVLNLISNAFKFTLEGGIFVSLKDAGTGVRLLVRDTGVGIPAAELPRVFERFHRIAGQRGRTHEGTGIGLALVQELVALHGGAIEADSVEGEGTTFRVMLPFGSSHLPAQQIQAAPTITTTALPASAFVEEALRWLPDPVEAPPIAPPAVDLDRIEGRPRVLIADDNADMRGYIRRILEDGGYAVEAVDDGAAALAAARRAPPELILSDVMMPELDGFQLLQTLRADPAMEGLLVILLVRPRRRGSPRRGPDRRGRRLSRQAVQRPRTAGSGRRRHSPGPPAARLGGARARPANPTGDSPQPSGTARGGATARSRLAGRPAGKLGARPANRRLRCLRDLPHQPGVGGVRLVQYHHKLLETIYPEDRPRVRKQLAAAIANGSDLDVEYRIVRLDQEIGWVLLRGRAQYAANGKPVALAGVSLDITDRKRAEERQRLLLDELNHRVKNTLATVQSIALQTRRTADTQAMFDDSFGSRIGALAQAHELLTRTSWEGTRLMDLVEQTMAPYARTGPGGERVVVDGPPIRLGPNAAVTMNMAFHELATNAAKYGALSVGGGKVGVRWSVDRSIEPPMLAIDWTERDGPSVAPPKRQGFGSRLLKSGLPRELGGSVAMDFAPEGLACRMRLALSGKIAVPD